MNDFRVNVSGLDRLVVKLIRAQSKPVVGKLAQRALWLIGVDVPAAVKIGPGFRFRHASSGLVLHPSCEIGANVTFLHGVTVGRSDLHRVADQPGTRVVIEDDVLVGAGAAILVKSGQQITIGKGAVIGSNAVITRDVAPAQVWAGNPAALVS